MPRSRRYSREEWARFVARVRGRLPRRDAEALIDFAEPDLNPGYEELADEEELVADRRELRDAEKFLHVLVGERTHPRRCGCPACDYGRYEKAPHGKGRLISRKLFFVYMLREGTELGFRPRFLRKMIVELASRPQPPAARALLDDLLRGKNAFVYAGRAARGKCSAILEYGPPA